MPGGGAGRAEWDAEHAVDPAAAGGLVGAQFPDLAGLAVEPLATGWDNAVFVVGGVWAFRFPRRAVALPGVRRELDLLPRLAPRLPLAVPVPQYVGAPAGDYPWPFWGARLLPGVELAESDLPDAARVDVAVAVGRFLRALHDPRLAAELGAELPVDPMRRAEPRARAPLARERLAALGRRGRIVPPAVAGLLEAGERLGPPTEAPVLVHGDLHARHVLVDRAGRACGIVDWGDVCLADPAVDLSLAYGGFAGPARAALLAAYGEVDPCRELRARVLAVSLCAALADYAAAERRSTLLAEAMRGLVRAAD